MGAWSCWKEESWEVSGKEVRVREEREHKIKLVGVSIAGADPQVGGTVTIQATYGTVTEPPKPIEITTLSLYQSGCHDHVLSPWPWQSLSLPSLPSQLSENTRN